MLGVVIEKLVPLNLQTAFGPVYDQAGYDYALDYAAPAEPPMSDEDSL
jgi:hypothetical protein